MPVKTNYEIFLTLLSHVRQVTEKGGKIYEEMSHVAQDAEVKEALEARAIVAQSVLSRIDECFKLIGQQPMKLSGHLQEVFLEDFRKEVSEIQSPGAKKLFVLAKLIHLTHLRIGEYVALVAAADLTGHYGVGVLLETCLADKLAFVERTRRLLRKVAEARVGERAVQEAA